MKVIFNINRFGKLIVKELSERLPMILKVSAVLSLILAGYWLTSLLFNADTTVTTQGRGIYLYLVTYFSAVMGPFNMYKSFNHRKKGLDYISLPASTTEKFASMTIISLIIMPLTVFISVLFTDTLISVVNPSVFNGLLLSNLFSDVSNVSFSDIVILPLFCLLGNMLYRGNKIVKSFLTIAAIYIVFTMIVAFLFLYAFKDQMAEIQGLQMQIRLTIDNLTELYRNEVFSNYPLIRFTIAFLAILYNVGFPVGALTGAYYRMKTIQY